MIFATTYNVEAERLMYLDFLWEVFSGWYVTLLLTKEMFIVKTLILKHRAIAAIA